MADEKDTAGTVTADVTASTDGTVDLDLDKVDKLLKERGLEPVEREPGGGGTDSGIDESVEQLRQRLADEAAARAAAEGRAAKAERGLAEARGKLHEGGVQQITDTIEMLERETNTLKQQWIEAQHAQDWEKAVEINDKLVGHRADIQNLKARKVQIETAPVQQRQAVVDTGPIAEQMARQMDAQGYRKSAEWIRAHPEWGNDPDRNAILVAAHNMAVKRGFAVDSDQYVADIERTIGLGSDDRRPVVRDTGGSGASDAAGGRRASAPSAAPPSRRGNGSGTGGRQRVTLSLDEIQTAKDNKMTPEEYYVHKQALIREGKIIVKH